MHIWLGGYDSSGTDIWLDGTTVNVGQLQVLSLDGDIYLLLYCPDWKLGDAYPELVTRALCEM